LASLHLHHYLHLLLHLVVLVVVAAYDVVFVLPKVAIVSVTGLYRTGKSFLLNLLMDNHNTERAFAVGSSVNACTKGIWICGTPIVTEDGTNIVFVVTEGLGSSERGHDTGQYICSCVCVFFYT
jgi:GTPase Era involved in 16S rRNA processing